MRSSAETRKVKVEKTLKKTQKTVHELQEQNTQLQKRVDELQLAYAKEEEMRQVLTQEDITRKEGLSVLRKEMEVLT